ncbi:uncharacterized protein LOC108033343 [Drosophila biarmipes]|uniref:uncharacterized protein LOC108033343 n=1 Tax=Drosophila biarmipes TaxID=125945 RepID=UPI0007E8392C|nr:uncharacterized protein LOC108033343 [Drosophila biarmipes]
MCSSLGLVVEGIPLGSGRQFSPRLTMKREYNTKCFRPERYCHEVANHYKDYKMQQNHRQQRLGYDYGSGSLGHRRRRRRRVLDTSASSTSGYAQLRDVWPTNVHYFPRADDNTYASRGRQTVCDGEPPDETYNVSVRRIKRAESCEQLRHLVHRIQWRSNCRSSYEAQVAPAPGSQTSKTGRLNNRLNINKCPVESLQQQLPLDFYGYLKLANSYYERGLQANVKYLQSIGQLDRNAITPPLSLFLDARQRALSPVQRLSDRLLKLLNSLRHKAAKEPVGYPDFWVSIRSFKREEPTKRKLWLEEEGFDTEEQEGEPPEQLDSMCDYYALGCTTTESGGPTETLAAGVTNSATRVTLATSTNEAALFDATFISPDQRRLYEITDNLSHLSIEDTSRRGHQLTPTLPAITLADCTAQQVALHSASLDIGALQMPNDPRPPNLRVKAT